MLKVKTEELKKVSKVLLKCAGLNSLKLVTCLLFLKAQNNCLTLRSTDGINELYVDLECDEELDIAIDIKQFNKLIQSLNCEYVELKEERNILHIKGKGEYRLPLVYDSSGNKIGFTDRRIAFSGNIIENDYANIFKQLKVSRADDGFQADCYKHFYFTENKVLATNTITASLLKRDKYVEEDRLMFNKTVELLGYMDSKLYVNDNHYRDNTYYLITRNNPNIAFYQKDDVMSFFEYSFTEKMLLSDLKEIVNRFAIFEHEILLIDKDRIVSKKEDIIEYLPFSFSSSLSISVKLLKTILNTIKTEYVEIFISDEILLIKNDEVEHVLSKYL